MPPLLTVLEQKSNLKVTTDEATRIEAYNPDAIGMQ